MLHAVVGTVVQSTPVIPTALLLAVVKKLTGFVKYVTAKDTKAVVTQIIAWVGGMALAWIGAHSDLLGGYAVLGHSLSSLNFVDQSLVGFGLGSGASYFLHDVLAGIDNADTASEPVLGG